MTIIPEKQTLGTKIIYINPTKYLHIFYQLVNFRAYEFIPVIIQERFVVLQVCFTAKLVGQYRTEPEAINAIKNNIDQLSYIDKYMIVDLKFVAPLHIDYNMIGKGQEINRKIYTYNDR